jgi:hypothetical protein
MKFKTLCITLLFGLIAPIALMANEGGPRSEGGGSSAGGTDLESALCILEMVDRGESPDGAACGLNLEQITCLTYKMSNQYGGARSISEVYKLINQCRR